MFLLVDLKVTLAQLLEDLPLGREGFIKSDNSSRLMPLRNQVENEDDIGAVWVFWVVGYRRRVKVRLSCGSARVAAPEHVLSRLLSGGIVRAESGLVQYDSLDLPNPAPL